VAIIKDRHARIIIVRPEITLHLEAGYIFAGCSRRNRFFLQFGGGPYMLRQPSQRLVFIAWVSYHFAPCKLEISPESIKPKRTKNSYDWQWIRTN
jgi:hypothetical protein